MAFRGRVHTYFGAAGKQMTSAPVKCSFAAAQGRLERSDPEPFGAGLTRVSSFGGPRRAVVLGFSLPGGLFRGSFQKVPRFEPWGESQQNKGLRANEIAGNFRNVHLGRPQYSDSQIGGRVHTYFGAAGSLCWERLTGPAKSTIPIIQASDVL